MAEELTAARIRLAWANAKLDAMRHEALLFMSEPPEPYTFEREIDPECGCEVLRAKIRRVPPMTLGLAVADAVHNLRTVLDMVTWAMALKLNPAVDPIEDRTTAFPICDKPNLWDGRSTQRAIQNLPSAAIPLIKSFQPYSRPDGIPGLGLVQSLDNWAKHKTLLDLFTFHATGFTMARNYELVEAFRGVFAHNDVVSHIIPIAIDQRLGFDPDQESEGGFTAFVGFAKGPPGEAYPLSQLASIYEAIRDKVLPAFDRFLDSPEAIIP